MNKTIARTILERIIHTNDCTKAEAWKAPKEEAAAFKQTFAELMAAKLINFWPAGMGSNLRGYLTLSYEGKAIVKEWERRDTLALMKKLGLD